MIKILITTSRYDVTIAKSRPIICMADTQRIATRELHETVGRPEMEDTDDMIANITERFKRGLKMMRSVLSRENCSIISIV